MNIPEFIISIWEHEWVTTTRNSATHEKIEFLHLLGWSK